MLQCKWDLYGQFSNTVATISPTLILTSWNSGGRESGSSSVAVLLNSKRLRTCLELCLGDNLGHKWLFGFRCRFLIVAVVRQKRPREDSRNQYLVAVTMVSCYPCQLSGTNMMTKGKFLHNNNQPRRSQLEALLFSTFKRCDFFTPNYNYFWHENSKFSAKIFFWILWFFFILHIFFYYSFFFFKFCEFLEQFWALKKKKITRYACIYLECLSSHKVSLERKMVAEAAEKATTKSALCYMCARAIFSLHSFVVRAFIFVEAEEHRIFCGRDEIMRWGKILGWG